MAIQSLPIKHKLSNTSSKKVHCVVATTYIYIFTHAYTFVYISFICICYESQKCYNPFGGLNGILHKRVCMVCIRIRSGLCICIQCVVLMICQRDLPLDTHYSSDGTCVTLRHLCQSPPILHS